MKNINWKLKQLIPFKYETYYWDNDGRYLMTTWRMWFGRCFSIREWHLSDEESISAKIKYFGIA